MGKLIQFPPPPRHIQREQDLENSDSDVYSNPDENDCPEGYDAACQPSDGAEHGSEQEEESISFFELLSVMPNCISRKIVAQVLSALAFLVAGFAILFLLKTFQSILFILIAAWVVWNTIMTVEDYKAGRIIEQAVVCVSVKPGLARNTTRVVMRTASEESPTYYEFRIAGRQTKSFTPNKVYIIYTREYLPQSLFAYQEL